MITRNIFLVALLFCLGFGCSIGKQQVGGSLIKTENQRPLDGFSGFYFPLRHADQNGNENAIDSFSNSWYSRMLFALKEPVLYNYTGNKEVYRFTWLRTFNHPISIRLEKEDSAITLIVKESNGRSGYGPGTIILDTVISLTNVQWMGFEQKIATTDFWNLPTRDTAEAGLDGAEWILESLKEGKYHIVVRWSPIVTKNQFADLGRDLIRLSKLRIDSRDLY